LMQVEPVSADLAGTWGAVIITSGNAAKAIAGNVAHDALVKVPLFAVGHRSAEAARQVGFTNVTSAGGDVHDLIRLVIARRADEKAPLLYLAGEDRAADLIGELTARGMAAEIRIIYRAVSAPFPPSLIEALSAGTVDAVMHFSRRSADNYVSGAAKAGVAGPAMAVRHLCLSAQAAEPLAGASGIVIAARPDEAGLIELLPPHRA
jgi:uroporphyrinogen-III synthase